MSEPADSTVRLTDTRAGVIGLVVTGDNHLSPALPRMSPLRRQERRAWVRRAFLAAVDYAITQHAALFLNTGDLFDSPAPSNLDRTFVAEQLHRLREAGVTCVAISGNHDTPRMQTEHGGDAPQQVYTANDDLIYLASTDLLEPLSFTLGGLRVAIAGLSNNPVAAPGSDPLADARWSASAIETLAEADVALLMLHAAIEGLARPDEGERTVTHASLAALPEKLRLVVAGHIHHFTQQRMAGRVVVMAGATERMEFGAQSGEPGFAWIELASDGVRHVEHIPIEAQPRVEITIETSDLWPDADAQDQGVTAETTHALDVIRERLRAACTPETMTRLRLTGELTRERYQQLALREVIAQGQQLAFSLDVDTNGLQLMEPTMPLRSPEVSAEAMSPEAMVALIVEESLARRENSPDGAPDADDLRAASEMLLAQLRMGGEEGE